MPLSTIFQLYHCDQFVCQTNMHLIMWIEKALNYVVNWFTFTKNGFLFFFIVKMENVGLSVDFHWTYGSQADLSFTWCLQVSVVPLTVRWFLEDIPLSFIFNTAGFVHSACTSASVVSGATRLDFENGHHNTALIQHYTISTTFHM